MKSLPSFLILALLLLSACRVTGGGGGTGSGFDANGGGTGTGTGTGSAALPRTPYWIAAATHLTDAGAEPARTTLFLGGTDAVGAVYGVVGDLMRLTHRGVLSPKKVDSPFVQDFRLASASLPGVALPPVASIRAKGAPVVYSFWNTDPFPGTGATLLKWLSAPGEPDRDEPISFDAGITVNGNYPGVKHDIAHAPSGDTFAMSHASDVSTYLSVQTSPSGGSATTRLVEQGASLSNGVLGTSVAFRSAGRLDLAYSPPEVNPLGGQNDGNSLAIRLEIPVDGSGVTPKLTLIAAYQKVPGNTIDEVRANLRSGIANCYYVGDVHLALGRSADPGEVRVAVTYQCFKKFVNASISPGNVSTNIALFTYRPDSPALTGVVHYYLSPPCLLAPPPPDGLGFTCAVPPFYGDDSDVRFNLAGNRVYTAYDDAVADPQPASGKVALLDWTGPSPAAPAATVVYGAAGAAHPRIAVDAKDDFAAFYQVGSRIYLGLGHWEKAALTVDEKGYEGPALPQTYGVITLGGAGFDDNRPGRSLGE